MKPLILASSSVPDFYKDDFSDLAVVFFFHFAWGKLSSPTKLAAHLGPRTRDGGPRQGDHWSDFASRWEWSKAKRLREMGYLLDGLAFGPTPAVIGLDEELRTIKRENLGGRQTAYRRSQLSLTEFGKSILAHKEDFSRHNPIDRWWGGTRLTNDRLWRWGPILTAPAKG